MRLPFNHSKIKRICKRNQSDLLHLPENFTKLIGKTISHHAVKAYQRQYQNPETEMKDKKTTKQSEVVEEKTQHSTNNQIVVDLIIHLQNQGNSLEDIAKKLNVGKTEIELFLRFHEKRKE